MLTSAVWLEFGDTIAAYVYYAQGIRCVVEDLWEWLLSNCARALVIDFE
jgi:hypothetical protein